MCVWGGGDILCTDFRKEELNALLDFYGEYVKLSLMAQHTAIHHSWTGMRCLLYRKFEHFQGKKHG